MNEAALAFESVSRSFGPAVALHPTTLRLEPHSCLALIGPSGCGKSTLLRLAVGLIQPDAGSIRIHGEQLFPGNARRLRLRMGYVIQEGGLFPHLTCRENVSLVAREEGRGADWIGARVAELASLTRLDPPLLNRFPGELSGGQRQRVGVMRALMLDPELLLMDEPLSALDPMVRAGLQAELKSIFQRLRKAVLFVTHDMAEAAYLGDEVALMRAGRMVQRGSPADLLRNPAELFVTEFLRAQRRPWAGLEGDA